MMKPCFGLMISVLISMVVGAACSDGARSERPFDDSADTGSDTGADTCGDEACLAPTDSNSDTDADSDADSDADGDIVISDLSVADVADIDDMGPGIDAEGKITDNPGLAIDSKHVYAFDFETGTGTEIGTGGDWGIHALGGPLFTDREPRLYLLSMSAELFMVDLADFSLSDVLIKGPEVSGAQPGQSGLAGPLTDCDTGFTPVV